MGVLHRDIKPDNFLLSEIGASSTVKLADFGLSTFFRRGEPEKEAVGSPFYMAPEMVMRGSPGYGPEADIWSCGVCLYKFLSGRLPFPGDTTSKVFRAIRHNEVYYSHPAWSGVSPAALDLLRRILQKDPASRISAEGILTSPWMMRYANGSSGRLVCPEGGSPSAAQGSEFEPAGAAPRGSRRSSTAVDPPALGAGRWDADAVDDDGSESGSRRGTGSSAGSSARRDPFTPSAVGASATAAGSPGGVGDPAVSVCNTSARIFFMPESSGERIRLHGFIDTFKQRLEAPYQRLLQAAGPETASAHWGDVCVGLQELNDFLVVHGSREGPFFLGREPSLAEAATAPALFRMVANLKVVRRIELLPTCEAMGMTRLVTWLTEVLSRPADVCAVAALPDHEYVKLARKMHVTYEGPPSSAQSPRSSYGGPLSPRSPSARSSLDSARGSALQLHVVNAVESTHAGPSAPSFLRSVSI